MSQIQRGKVVTVERGSKRPNAAAGLLKGMAVVWDHWAASFRKNTGFEQIRGNFTVEYPEERLKLPETYRNMPILLYDEASGHELCTSCFQCQRICPPQVIHMAQAKDPQTGKAVPAVAEFVIEYDACMSCGFCAEVCPFDAIKMDHAFELSTADHAGLTLDKEQLNRPISYYAGLAPTLWDEVKAGALKKLQGNIKRRPDLLGMAPNLAEKIQARRRELEAEGKQAAKPEPGQAADGKAAKLAAIRAANAAKQAGEAAAAPPAAEAAPADDKAARLAAIRAKNAAAKTVAEDTPAPAEAAPTDDKAARLAAIRAKNAAAKAAAEGIIAPEPDALAAATAESPEAAAVDPEALVKPDEATPTDEQAPDAEPSPPAAPSPAHEKAARLAAIRAANAAKRAAAERSGPPADEQGDR